MKLEYTLVANTKNVEYAYRRLETLAKKHNDVIHRLANEPAKNTNGGSSPGVKAKEREEVAKTKATEKGERDRLRLVEKEAREESKVRERWANHNNKLNSQHIREQAKQVEKTAREEARVRERWDTYNAKLKDQHARRQAQDEQQRVVDIVRKRQNIVGTVGGIAGGTARTVMGAARGAIAMTGLGGGMLVASAIGGRMAAEKSAAGLANQMASSGDTTEQIKASREGILKNAEGIKGFTTEQALDAQRTFGGKAGDYGLGGKMLQKFANVSLATDVDINDVADVAANVFMKLKSENPKSTQNDLVNQTMEAVQVFAGQGNVGSVEMKDLAKYSGRLTAGAAKFEGSRIHNMGRMGALAQIAIGSGTASTAEEATTAAGRFASDLTKNEQAQKKYGIKKTDIYTDDSFTKLKDVKSIIKTFMTKTGGALPAMGKLVGEESKKMMEGVSLEYNSAEDRNKALKDGDPNKLAKGKAGEAAIDAMFATFEKASLETKDVEARAAAALTTSQAQLKENMKQLTDQLGSRLLPVLNDAIPAIADMTPQIIKATEAVVGVVQWFADLSIGEKIGAVVGTAMLKEIGVWGIGIAGKAAIEGAVKLLTPASALPGVPGASTALGAAPGALSTAGGVTLGALAAPAIMATIGVGSVAALAYQQDQRKGEQQSRGDATVDKLKGQLGEAGGLWGMAVAEEDANKALSKQFRRSVEAGGGTEQFDVMQTKKAEVTAATTEAMTKQQAVVLTAAIQSLAGAVKGERGDAPTWLDP